jgi:hypothetical protein
MARAATKQQLKQQFAQWAIWTFDINHAFQCWTRLWTSGLFGPQRQVPTTSDHYLHLLALVAAYGRIFTGDTKLPGGTPWVLPEEREIHQHLLALRHGSVAHSSSDIERVRLYPPGSEVDGQQVKGDDHLDWAWQVQALAPKTNFNALDGHLRRLHAAIHAKASEALKRLQQSCGNPVLPPGQTQLSAL